MRRALRCASRSARRAQPSEQYLRTRAHGTHAKNSRPQSPHQSRHRICSTPRSASGCRKFAQIEQTVRHGHYRRALRKYARCEGLGGNPSLPPFVGGAPLSRAGLAVLGRSGRLLGCPTEPPRCQVDHWITAAPLEVDLRRTAGHSSTRRRLACSASTQVTRRRRRESRIRTPDSRRICESTSMLAFQSSYPRPKSRTC